MKPQGVCIIAAGEPCFGVYAYNLAVSIKFRDPSAEIAVFYEPRTLCGLEPQELNVFDELIELTPQHNFWYQGRINPVGWKLRAHLYSPYERTILLDADSIWYGNRTVTSFFDGEMAGLDWATSSHGVAHVIGPDGVNDFLMDHGPMWQIEKEFQIPLGRTVHECYTQWFYAARNERTDALLKKAISLYDDCQMGLRMRGSIWRNAMVNDELVLSVATALCETAPGRIPFTPTTDGSVKSLSPEHVIVNIVGSDDTEKSLVALKIYKFICDMIQDVGFRWLPKPWSPKVYPY
jgi:hypothetical protein